MDSTIIAALITACSSALWYVFGLLKKDSSLFSLRFKLSKEVLHEQLSYVYEPLTKILDYSSETNQELVAAASEIFDNHYLLIPNELKEPLSTLSRGSNLDRKQFIYLSAFVLTNYNWAKKVLGYPFDPEQIDKKLLPQYNQRQSNKTVFWAILGSLTNITAFLFPVLLWFLEFSPESKTENFPQWITALEHVSGICFLVCVSNALLKIGKKIHSRKQRNKLLKK